MPPELAVTLYGLASAISWGAGDFCGGLAARRANAFAVSLVAHWVGLVLLILVAVARADPFPSSTSLAWAFAAGLCGAVGITALYRALALGQMGVAAPITAVLSAGIPALVGIFLHGLPDLFQLMGFALALVGVWFIARSEHAGAGRLGVFIALLAGLGFGGHLTFMSRAGAEGVFWPLAMARGTSSLVVLLLTLLNRRSLAWSRPVLPIMLLAGALDVTGNTLYVLASQVGRLDVAAVLSSLYPASTVLLARLYLDERLSQAQIIGVVTVLFAIVLITL